MEKATGSVPTNAFSDKYRFLTDRDNRTNHHVMSPLIVAAQSHAHQGLYDIDAQHALKLDEADDAVQVAVQLVGSKVQVLHLG